MKYYTVLFLYFFCLYEVRMDTQTIKILHVNEDINKIANKSVEVALQYIKHRLNIEVDIRNVVGSKNDSKILLQSLCSTYEEMMSSQAGPFIVLDTTVIGIVSETVKHFTSSMTLPTISGSYGQWNKNKQKYLIHIAPPADTVIHIVKAFIILQKITNAAILYDSHYGMNIKFRLITDPKKCLLLVMVHKLQSLLVNFSTRHVIVPVEYNETIIQLKRLKKLGILNFFIFGDSNTFQIVLNAANSIDFLIKRYAWYIINLYNDDFICDCKNVTILYVTPSLKSTTTIDYLKKTYNFYKEPIMMSAFYFDLTMLAVLTVRDILNNKSWPQNIVYLTCKELVPVLKSTRYNFDLQKYIYKNTSHLSAYGSFNILENQMEFNMTLSAVTIYNGVINHVKDLGTWSPKLKNNFSLLNSDPHIMASYVNNQYFRVFTVEQKPFVYVDKTAPNGVKGYCIDLMELIAAYCNFTYNIRVADTSQFATINDNGEWNGWIRELIDDKADIALGSLYITEERATVIDFTVPYYEGVGITVLMKGYIPSKSLFKFLSVLEIEVWLCILAAYCFTSFIMWVFDRYSPCSYQNNIKKYKNSNEKRIFSFKECLWFCITSLTPQGGGEAPKNPSGRLIAGTWWLFGFIIISSYTANLAAFLTVTRLENPVSSMNELSQQYRISYAPVNDSMVMDYFKQMVYIEQKFYEYWEDITLDDKLSAMEKTKYAVWEYPISDKYTKMWREMKNTGLPATHEDAVERVRNSESSTNGFAYIGDAIDLKYLALLHCDLEVIGEDFSKKPLALAVQKNSPLKQLISNAIMDLMVKRKLELLKQKWWNDNPEKQICSEENIIHGGISVRNIGGVFIIIFIGIFLAYVGAIIQRKKK